MPALYNVCIYGAVHHHVLHRFGLGTAVNTFQKITRSCVDTLFFETGQLCEGGRWRWQATMRRFFKSDEEHIHYFLSTIENRIQKIEVIGKYHIHGVRRWYLKISLDADRDIQTVFKATDLVSLSEKISWEHGRTFGSRGQKLIPWKSPETEDSPGWYAVSTIYEGQRVFLKRHLHRPLAHQKEHLVSSHIREKWAIRSLGVLPDLETLVFPYMQECIGVRDAINYSKVQRTEIARQLVHIFHQAEDISVSLPEFPLLPIVKDATLLDVCDLNINNFLIKLDFNNANVFLVDFEQQSTKYRYYNNIHLGKMLVILRCMPLTAISQLLRGYAGVIGLLARFQFTPVARRIQLRQPSLVSIICTAVRTITGSIVGRLLHRLGAD